jgi:hypothetical protein
MKKQCFFLITFFVLHSVVSDAQFNEIGAFAGISNYAGDLTDRNFEPLECNFAGGFYLRNRGKGRLGWKAHLYRGVLSGNDANTAVESGLWQRNLSFRSEIYELGAVAEYHLIRLQSGYYEFSPYLFGGAAAFYFNPQAAVNGKTYNLQHFRTEGVEYSLFQYALPFGAGLRLELGRKVSFGLEGGLRKTFTDYLDDVSHSYPANIRELAETNSLTVLLSYRGKETASDAPLLPEPGAPRGNPARKDWYMFFGLTLGIFIGK